MKLRVISVGLIACLAVLGAAVSRGESSDGVGKPLPVTKGGTLFSGTLAAGQSPGPIDLDVSGYEHIRVFLDTKPATPTPPNFPQIAMVRAFPYQPNGTVFPLESFTATEGGIYDENMQRLVRYAGDTVHALNGASRLRFQIKNQLDEMCANSECEGAEPSLTTTVQYILFR